MRLRVHATVVTCLVSLFLLLGGYEQPAATALAAPSTTNISAAGSSFAAPMFTKDLIRWVLTGGRSYADALWYVPLPDNVVQGGVAALQPGNGS